MAVFDRVNLYGHKFNTLLVITYTFKMVRALIIGSVFLPFPLLKQIDGMLFGTKHILVGIILCHI